MMMQQVLQRHAGLAPSPRSLVLVAPGNPRLPSQASPLAAASTAAGELMPSDPSSSPGAAYGFRGCLFLSSYAMWRRLPKAMEPDSEAAPPSVAAASDYVRVLGDAAQRSEASGYKLCGAERDSEAEVQQRDATECQNVEWVKTLSSETEPWVKGLYLNEVSFLRSWD